MGLPQLGQFFARLHVGFVERVFPLQVLKHFLVADAEVLDFFSQGNNGLLHLVLFQLPVALGVSLLIVVRLRALPTLHVAVSNQLLGGSLLIGAADRNAQVHGLHAVLEVLVAILEVHVLFPFENYLPF